MPHARTTSDLWEVNGVLYEAMDMPRTEYLCHTRCEMPSTACHTRLIACNSNRTDRRRVYWRRVVQSTDELED